MKLFIRISSPLLILLWVYTAASKLSNLAAFQSEMAAQVFGPAFTRVLIVLIPGLELIAALLLLSSKFLRVGFALSSVLLLAFTIYIVLILGGYYPRVPCSCGGVLKSLGWWEHLWFNLFFLSVASLSWWGARSPKPITPT